MACSKWEQSGLLYVSGELSDTEAREYEQHMDSCQECRSETDTYKSERGRLYSVEMLGASPSPKVDNEILRVCSVPARPVSSIGLFGALVTRPVAAALLFLLIGVGTGTYVAYHADNAQRIAEQNKSSQQQLLATDTSRSMPAETVASSNAPAGTSDSSLSDSAGDSTPFPRSPNARSKGVMPVDLENKQK
ncbi:MAG: hypothetical protein GF331_12640 [Chitinivibrionales bacterium]|nr:hypothetical protein [Chitinivibrionales bacterium]